jgi:hypothetical protein
MAWTQHFLRSVSTHTKARYISTGPHTNLLAPKHDQYNLKISHADSAILTTAHTLQRVILHAVNGWNSLKRINHLQQLFPQITLVRHMPISMTIHSISNRKGSRQHPRLQRHKYVHLPHCCLAVLSVTIKNSKLKLNSVAWVRERTIPTERPPLVAEVSTNFFG